jgi:ATP-binding cassette subfamily B protein
MQKATEPEKGYTKATFGYYLRAAGKYPLLVIGAFAFMLVAQATVLASPLYLRTFFNTLVTGSPTPELVSALVSTLIIIGTLSFINWAAFRLEFYFITYLDGRVMRDLYDTAFNYLIRHSYHFFSNQFAGTLTRRVGRFSKSFEMIFDGIVMQFVPTAIFITGAVIILYLRNPLLGTALLLWVLVFLLVQMIALRLQQPLRLERVARDSELTGALADAIGNQTTIQVFSGGRFETDRVNEVASRWYKATIRNWNASEFTWGILGLLTVAINVGLLYGALVLWSQNLVTVGDFVLIQAYLLTTFDRLFGINREFRHFNEAVADASEMTEILKTPLEVRDAPHAKRLVASHGAIAFSNVEFSFTDAPILKEFNLSIGGGEKIALIGPSGAGKSTVTKLLLRFYDVKGGSVTIDGVDIREVSQDSLREAIAFVPQEPILFHRTLMENIRYGRRGATDAEVIEAAKQAHCYEFIMQTPEQFNTYVGERGIKLSGGERQRIAIARAILKDAPILVLDEATSSLDSESEALIQDALEKLMEGKTVIAIAHRLSTVMKMDRIVVIESGNVVMTGTHDELLSHEGGLYKKLWEIQAGGFIQDDTDERLLEDDD